MSISAELIKKNYNSLVEKGHSVEVVPYTAGDGMPLSLIHVSRPANGNSKPVMLVHGAGVRANIFCAPVDTTIIDTLIENGFDVWLQNWRASMDHAPNIWSLDKAAVHDHPQAVKTVLQQTGQSNIQAIIHCQGSTSFMMSAVAGLVPEVTTIVSNAVSLHPVVPLTAKIKINLAPPFVRPFTKYLNPQWAINPPGLFARLLNGLVRLTHHECNNMVCKQSSFCYGVGFPVLWRHENLNDVTHEWLKNEFGFLPMNFFSQMAPSVNRGHLLSIDDFSQLPKDFVKATPKTNSRFAFFAGKKNRCFLSESQQRTWKHFNHLQPDKHTLHIIENYGHLDIFMGQNASRDVFPLMIEELSKQG